MNKKAVSLAAVMILTAACGIWVLRYPSRERQAVAYNQEILMLEIFAEISEYSPVHLMYCDVLPESIEPPEYDEPEVQDETPDAPEAAECEASYYEEFYPEELPETAFPSAIQGTGILTIERINLQLPIAEGVEYDTLRITPGRVPQTAQIGATGNAVIAGHRNYTFGSMFNRLGELETGDIVGFQARNGENMRFEVFEIAVIRPCDQIAFIQPVNDAIITLFTCTPITTATHRLIIRAQRIY